MRKAQLQPVRPEFSGAEAMAVLVMLGRKQMPVAGRSRGQVISGLRFEPQLMDWLQGEFDGQAHVLIQELEDRIETARMSGGLADLALTRTDLQFIDVALGINISNATRAGQDVRELGITARRLAHLHSMLRLEVALHRAMRRPKVCGSRDHARKLVDAARELRRERGTDFQGVFVIAPERLLLEDAISLVRGRPMQSVFAGDVERARAAFAERVRPVVDLRPESRVLGRAASGLRA